LQEHSTLNENFSLSFHLKLVQEMATRQRIIAAESILPVCHRFSS